jgi:hypothetical protein
MSDTLQNSFNMQIVRMSLVVADEVSANVSVSAWMWVWMGLLSGAADMDRLGCVNEIIIHTHDDFVKNDAVKLFHKHCKLE